MKIYLFLILQLSFYFPAISAEVNIESYIDAWKIANTSQTHRSAVFFDRLDAEKDTLKFKETLAALYRYLRQNPDKRIEARILMFDAFGSMVFQFQDEKYKRMLERAMHIAHELRDEQLMSEIYVYYAEVAAQNNHLLYNLKAIEIQKRIGFEHFYTVHNRFFIVSNALYHSHEYRQSISYGLQCLAFAGVDNEHWLRKVYILQLDILGAAYKKLELYDSAVYYYQKILDTLTARPDSGYMQTLWTGIAKGNIGYCLAMKGNITAAIPLIDEYIDNSTKAADWINVSMANNALAAAYYRHKNLDHALKAWQRAYYWSVKTASIDNSLEAARGITELYRVRGQTDSSFYYYKLYHQYSDTINRRLEQSRLSAMNARIAFDNLQDSLGKSQAALSRSRFTLQVIVAGTVLLLVILVLLYSRYHLKEKHKLQLIQRKKEEAEQDAKNAKAQIAQFMNHLVEKNNLIESMQAQLMRDDRDTNSGFVMQDLSQYTLVSEDEWEKFRSDFSKAYPAFMAALRKCLPQASPAEERLSILIFLKLNNYQLANTLGIGKESVARAKRRLKQRLNLPDTAALDDYLVNLLENNK